MTWGASLTKLALHSLGASRGLHLFPFDITYLSYTSRFQMSGKSGCWQLEHWRSLQPHFSKLARYDRKIKSVYFRAKEKYIMNFFSCPVLLWSPDTGSLNSFTGNEAPPQHVFYWHCCFFFPYFPCPYNKGLCDLHLKAVTARGHVSNLVSDSCKTFQKENPNWENNSHIDCALY